MLPLQEELGVVGKVERDQHLFVLGTTKHDAPVW